MRQPFESPQQSGPVGLGCIGEVGRPRRKQQRQFGRDSGISQDLVMRNPSGTGILRQHGFTRRIQPVKLGALPQQRQILRAGFVHDPPKTGGPAPLRAITLLPNRVV